jgi:hypothetical protein
MELNMEAAWSAATTMVRTNQKMVLAVAGLFIFLPNLVLGVLVPELGGGMPASSSNSADMDKVMDAMLTAMADQYREYWWAMLLVTIFQVSGMLALYGLLTDPARLTVGEALSRGAKLLLPYIAAQVLMVGAIMLAIALPMVLAGMTGVQALVASVGIMSLVLGVYLFIKFSLVSAVIGIEQEMNPIKALQRSWALTKGNSLRLAAFLLLLFIAIIVVSVLVTLVFGLIFAVMGEAAQSFGQALSAGIVNTVIAVVFLAVFAAVHRQLSGGAEPSSAETFE